MALGCIATAMNAQSPKVNTHHFRSSSNETPNTGFCWADRPSYLSEIKTIGDKEGAGYLALMETPMLVGAHTLEAIHFPYMDTDNDKNAKIIVLNSNGTIVYSQPIEKLDGLAWNTIKLTTPFTLKDDKYFVGLFYHSIVREDVLGYDGSLLSIPESNIIKTFDKGDTPSFTIGDKIDGLHPEKSQLGSFIMTADITGPSVEHVGVSLIISADNGSVGNVGSQIPMTLTLRNVGTKAINSVVVSVISQGKEQDIEANVNIPVGYTGICKFKYTIPEVNGEETAIASIKSINGIANSHKDKGVAFTYTATSNKGPQKVSTVLIEEFTSEPCGACPYAKPKVEDLIKTLQNNGYKVSAIAHHDGYKSDFMTIPESQSIVNYFGVTGNPYVMINRIYINNSFTINPTGGDLSHTGHEMVMNRQQTAFIDDMGFSDNGISIEGHVANSSIDKDKTYIHVVITEDGIKAKKQTNGGANFIHNFVARKFFFDPIIGEKINIKDDNTFELNIPAFKIPQEWNKKNLKAVAYITKEMNPGKIKNPFTAMILGSNNVPYGQLLSTQGIENNKPTITIIDHRINVNGSYDNIQVFDMSGAIVATSTDTPLPEGCYIVRLSNLMGNYTYKVCVQM